MGEVVRDPFWDSSGGSLRCSSVGADAEKYHDPSSHVLEGNNGRAISSLLPSSGGLRGVIIPRATEFGGSRGFDAHKPRLINIDPDIKGQSCVVDLSKISKEDVEAAFQAAGQNELIGGDLALRAAQTFHNLSISTEPVGMNSPSAPRNDRLPPMFGNAYVVPKSRMGGGQMMEEQAKVPMNNASNMMSPSVTPRRVQEKQAEQVEYMQQEEVQSPVFLDQSIKTQPSIRRPAAPVQRPSPQSNMTQTQPATRVVFETEGWGQFESQYHEVIKSDCLLILVYDLRFKAGIKYFPPMSDKLMAVKIETQEKVYFVNSYGNRFVHNNYEYCILIIDQDSEVASDDV